jgi:predicted GNAT family acetyltransferase
MTEQQATRVVRDDDRHRYEVYYGDALAGFADYLPAEDRVVFVHTEIGKQFGGRGLGSVLARHAVADVIASGKAIVAQCPFIAGYLDKHPEYDPHVIGKGLS